MPGQSHEAPRMVMLSPAAPRRSNCSTHMPSQTVSFLYSSRASLNHFCSSCISHQLVIPDAIRPCSNGVQVCNCRGQILIQFAQAFCADQMHQGQVGKGHVEILLFIERLISAREPGVYHADLPSAAPERLMKNAKSSLNASCGLAVLSERKLSRYHELRKSLG